MVELNHTYEKIKAAGAEVLAIHVECSPAGTALTVRRQSIQFPMANDDRLQVVDKYSPTSTWLIDADGVIRARWLGHIHERVGAGAILEALARLTPAANR
ncbi:MAG: redoxin domain-containing protein [Verrucomicrobia bacterium]|nr:redoxin domain-containing protein [Verrucomicrobiota bacterium]